MPTIHDQQGVLEEFKRDLEAGGEMTDNPGGITLTGAQIDDQGLSWIEVMPTVEKARNGSWFFTVTADDLGTLAEYIQANPDRIPIDYDHSGSEDGGSTRAAGWFTGETQVVEAGGRNPTGDVQEGASVWAQVKWTPTAVEEIRGGDFRFISPEWGFANKDSKTGLLTKLVDIAAATLTNRPFFKDLAPVTARELAEKVAELAITTADIEALLASSPGGNPSAADQGDEDDTKEIIVADEQPVTDYMKLLGLDNTVDPKQRLAVAFREKDEKIVALEQTVAELRTTSDSKGQEAEELAQRVEELEQKDRTRDIEVILAKAVDTGRTFPSEKKTLSELFASDVNGLKRLIATRSPEMFAGLKPKGVAGDPERFADDPDVSQYVKTIGAGDDPVDTEQAKHHLTAMQLLKEQGKAETYTNDEYVEAYNKATSLVY